MINGMKIIDADGHVQERDAPWQDLLEQPYRKHAPRVVKDPNGRSELLLEGKIWAKPSGVGCGIDTAPISRRPQSTTGMFDPVQRLKDMDLEGIDIAVNFGTTVFLSLPFLENHDLACAIARAYNNWLAEHCAVNKERLLGVAMIPLQEPELAVKEARRAVIELGHRGFFISPHPVDNRNLDHPAYEPLWSMAEELNVPALVHVSTGIRLPTAGAERFDRYCLFHLHAHPMEQMTAAASLILGGVLERHPRLRVGFMEAGCGWVPYWLERMDEHAENYRFELPHLKEQPSVYFRRQCFVSFELEERAVSYVAEAIGAQTLVFASDFPHHDCFFPGAVEKIRKRADLDDKLVTAMLSENPHRLYFGD